MTKWSRSTQYPGGWRVTDDRLAGRLEGREHVLSIRVYHEDTDFSGAVYHGSYVRFLERGRSDFLRLAGVSHVLLAAEGLHFAVSGMTTKFHRAAAIDDVLQIVTRIGDLTGARVVLDQSVRRANTKLVTARVTVVLIDRTGHPRRFPAGVSAPLSARFNTS